MCKATGWSCANTVADEILCGPTFNYWREAERPLGWFERLCYRFWTWVG
jgi:hypothetical protein